MGAGMNDLVVRRGRFPVHIEVLRGRRPKVVAASERLAELGKKEVVINSNTDSSASAAGVRTFLHCMLESRRTRVNIEASAAARCGRSGVVSRVLVHVSSLTFGSLPPVGRGPPWLGIIKGRRKHRTALPTCTETLHLRDRGDILRTNAILSHLMRLCLGT